MHSKAQKIRHAISWAIVSFLERFKEKKRSFFREPRELKMLSDEAAVCTCWLTAYLTHSSLQNGIKPPLRCVPVSRNHLLLHFFVETIHFVRKRQEVTETKRGDTVWEQLVSIITKPNYDNSIIIRKSSEIMCFIIPENKHWDLFIFSVHWYMHKYVLTVLTCGTVCTHVH